MMKRCRYAILTLLALLCLAGSAAAQKQRLTIDAGSKRIRIVIPDGYALGSVENGDTIPHVYLPTVYVFPELKFKSEKERQQYAKLVRDVKRTLPYARMVYETLIETYEYIETLPDEKAKKAHLKRMELVDRECHQSSYNLAKAYLGTFRAGFWNLFAGMFGASLKTKYDPNGKDALTERVVLLVQCGAI